MVTVKLPKDVRRLEAGIFIQFRCGPFCLPLRGKMFTIIKENFLLTAVVYKAPTENTLNARVFSQGRIFIVSEEGKESVIHFLPPTLAPTVKGIN